MLIKRAGFSLIEMLVAVVLLSLMIGVAVFSFKYQLIAIQKTKKVGINKVITYNQIRTSLQSIKYYIVDDYDMLNYPMKKLHTYFKGTKTKINFITTSPLFSKDIALAKLECIEDSLIYQEEALYGDIDFMRPELKEESKSITFYSNLQKCEFNYLYDDIFVETLTDKIPKDIMLKLTQNEIINELYVNVKSDYNRSRGTVYDAIYPDN